MLSPCPKSRTRGSPIHPARSTPHQDAALHPCRFPFIRVLCVAQVYNDVYWHEKTPQLIHLLSSFSNQLQDDTSPSCNTSNNLGAPVDIWRFDASFYSQMDIRLTLSKFADAQHSLLVRQTGQFWGSATFVSKPLLQRNPWLYLFRSYTAIPHVPKPFDALDLFEGTANDQSCKVAVRSKP